MFSSTIALASEGLGGQRCLYYFCEIKHGRGCKMGYLIFLVLV